MNPSKRNLIVASVGVALVLLAVFLLVPRAPEPLKIADGEVYYTGPMRAKGGDTYGGEDGKSYTAAEAAAAEKNSKSPQNAKRTP